MFRVGLKPMELWFLFLGNSNAWIQGLGMFGIESSLKPFGMLNAAQNTASGRQLTQAQQTLKSTSSPCLTPKPSLNFKAQSLKPQPSKASLKSCKIGWLQGLWFRVEGWVLPPPMESLY